MFCLLLSNNCLSCLSVTMHIGRQDYVRSSIIKQLSRLHVCLNKFSTLEQVYTMGCLNSKPEQPRIIEPIRLANEDKASSVDWTNTRYRVQDNVKEPKIKLKIIERQYMPKKPARGGGNIGRTSKHAKYLRRQREDEDERDKYNERQREDMARRRREDPEGRQEEREKDANAKARRRASQDESARARYQEEIEQNRIRNEQWRREDEERRAMERERDAERTARLRSEDEERREAERARDAEHRAHRRSQPDARAQERDRDRSARARRMESPTERERHRQRMEDMRLDEEYRQAELQQQRQTYHAQQQEEFDQEEFEREMMRQTELEEDRQTVWAIHENKIRELAAGYFEGQYFKGNPIIEKGGRQFFSSLEAEDWQKCSVCEENYIFVRLRPRSRQCDRCAVQKTGKKIFAKENDLTPSMTPECLKRLSPIEIMAISMICPILAIYKKGSSLASKGHCLSIHQEVGELAQTLPRVPEDIPIIVLKAPSKNNTEREFHCNRKNMLEALEYLKANNEDYKNIPITLTWTKSFPKVTKSRSFKMWKASWSDKSCAPIVFISTRVKAFLTGSSSAVSSTVAFRMA